jgi:Protein of unknown function (DUF664)
MSDSGTSCSSSGRTCSYAERASVVRSDVQTESLQRGGVAAPSVNREMELLLGYLDAQRRHVLGILEGLSEEQLGRPVLPSGWHCLGLIKHLAWSDEHYWFRSVVAGEQMDDLPQGPDSHWRVGPDESATDVFEHYRDEIRRSNEILVETDLDAAPKQPDPDWATWGVDFPDVRSVVMHVITETAVHAGHLDAVRELIDGRQWLVL